MRGLKRDHALRIVTTGHAFVQNLRRGHYELATEPSVLDRVAVAFTELALARLIDLARQPLPPAPPPHNATKPLRATGP